jgi:hypothetical protein
MFLNYNFASRINGSGQIPAHLQNRIQRQNRFSADITRGAAPKNVIKRDDFQ